MFTTVSLNILVMLFYMAIGFVIVKTKVGNASHAKTLSAILIYALVPAMITNSFLNMEYSMENLKNVGFFFIGSLIILFGFFFILFFVFRKKSDEARYRILTVAAVLGNVGFFGIPVITSIFPESTVVACYGSIYSASMNIIAFTAGTFMITNNKKFISLKSGLINSAMIAVVVSIPLYLFQVKLPDIVMTPLGLLAKMVTPVCMIILGMRLATTTFKSLISRPFVYAAVYIKLVIFPLFAYLCVLFIPGLDTTFKVSMFILSAAPSASILSALSELHECEQELCANVILVSTIVSVITLPLMSLIVL